MADLFGVHPTLVTKIARVLDRMRAAGHPMRVCQGLRTVAMQAALYQQGRTVPGKRVTNADGVRKLSNHQAKEDGPYRGYGCAVDCCFATGDPFGEAQPWRLYGEAVRAEGLVWGGDWVRFVDRPHAELPPPITGTVQA